ncbi:MAG TPA: phospho-N-acetylmuramoyl-pentapeptide-transferase [Peptococcaceae bacterium]|nr:MAG: Phospho-N-acetylmuramoyl-pentapeptide-transferase [Clostridia bacterium 41_269]HBT20114.1 phospho-N-acetylmuramoyl-pentapeptide-transferase [Peptococcaceae bacterium]
MSQLADFAPILLKAFLASLILTILLGPVIIPILNKLRLGQYIRQEGPAKHFKKAGTPTMGGIIFIIPLLISTMIFAGESAEALTAATVTLGYGIIGFIDDFIKVALKRSLGLKARYKLLGQLIMGFFLALLAVKYLGRGTDLRIPFTDYMLELGSLYYPFVLLVLVSSTNAVNLTDGLDGLAAGCTMFVSIGYVFISLLLGTTELAVFAAALAGGCFGFLAFNFYPAKVFMGDTGSLALGAAVACLAVLTGTELVLPIVGGIYVIETLSVVLQVASFRLRGKRIFLMSPLHHHFELAGWEEEKIVLLFWAFSALFSLLGVLSVIKIG